MTPGFKICLHHQVHFRALSQYTSVYTPDRSVPPIMSPTYLTGDKAGIDEFLSRFDVRVTA